MEILLPSHFAFDDDFRCSAAALLRFLLSLPSSL